MTTDARIVSTPEEWPLVEAALRAAVIAQLNDNMVPLVISLRRYSPPRSNEANNRLWWLHGLMAAHLNERVPEMIAAKLLPRSWQRFTPEAVHEGIFKPRFCGVRPDGMPRSSTRLSKADFSEAMQRYEADMVNEGVEIPEHPLGDAEGWR